MTHKAWDDGAIAASFRDVLGIDIGQKTTKTRCGKRVSMRHIDNVEPTCGACLTEPERERKGRAEIAAYCRSNGIDVPNGF